MGGDKGNITKGGVGDRNRDGAGDSSRVRVCMCWVYGYVCWEEEVMVHGDTGESGWEVTQPVSGETETVCGG